MGLIMEQIRPKKTGIGGMFSGELKKTGRWGRLGEVGEVRKLKLMGPSIVAMIFGSFFGFLGWDFCWINKTSKENPALLFVRPGKRTTL